MGQISAKNGLAGLAPEFSHGLLDFFHTAKAEASIFSRCRLFTRPPFEGAFASSTTSCHGALPFSVPTPLSSNRARPSDMSPAGPTSRGKRRECQIASNRDPFSRPITALTHIWCTSSGPDQASFEQVDFRASIHLPFHEFELGDLAFGLAVGPVRLDSGADRALVLRDAVGK